jgi:spore coat protein U-like protein
VRAFRTALAVVVLAWAPAARAVCWIATTGPAFGPYDPLSPAPVDAAGSVQYVCSTPSKVSFSTGSSGNFASRAMQGAQGALMYNLFVDAARTQIWGDGTAGTVLPTVPAGLFRSVPVYGRVPARQNVAAGSYSDSLVVTFIF